MIRATARYASAFLLAIALAALMEPAPIRSQTPAFDLVVRGGRVVDGTGNPWFVADVGIKGDAIVAVGPRLDATGARVVDAQGMVVGPVSSTSTRMSKPATAVRT